ncbi:MAG: (Fe-S)-binding protein, partial [Myxococcales bacterium]|nr:(Fe-S)-binding protein [Myxococcales bacterium]
MSDTFSQDSVARQLDNCTYCPKMCRHSCPVAAADARETHTPQAKMDTLNHLREGKLAWTRENTEALWACTGCRACTTYCEHENEPALVLLSGRSRANAEG